jgi:hypothetical protein
VIGNAEINQARQYVADALGSENPSEKVTEMGIDAESMIATMFGALQKAIEHGVGPEAFAVGLFLVGFVCGRWEEHNEREASDGIA